MAKQSKARNKAFQAAAAHMTAKDTYTTPEDYGWNLIWDAAKAWTVRNWRAKVTNLELGIGSLEASVAGRDAEIERLDKKILVQAGIIEQQRVNLHSQSETITRLRDERTVLRDKLKVAMTEMADKVHSESFTEVLERKEIKKAVPRPLLCRATDMSRTHSCFRTPGGHRQHVCHCNALWNSSASYSTPDDS